MKKFQTLFLGLAMGMFVMLGSSCFDLIENVTFYKDGSGHMEFKVDMTEMMGMLDALGNIGGEEEGEEMDFAEEMREVLQEDIEAMKEMRGVTNVELIADNAGIFGYSFDFTDIDALNEVQNMSDISQGMSLPGTDGMNFSGEGSEEFFKQKKRKMWRSFRTLSEKDLEEFQGEEGQMAMMLFQDSHYYANYTFEQGVKKVKSDYAVIEGKTVKIKVPWEDLLKNKLSDPILMKLK